MKPVEEYRHTSAPFENPLANLSLRLQGVIWEIMDRYEVDWQTVLSRKREARVRDARHLIASFFCWHSSMSLVEIGKFLGGRDHGTVINSRNKIARLYHSDLKIRDLVDDIEERHLFIEDHSVIPRDRSACSLHRFVLPSPIKPAVPRDSDGRRTLTTAQIREENRELRRKFKPGSKGGLR